MYDEWPGLKTALDIFPIASYDHGNKAISCGKSPRLCRISGAGDLTNIRISASGHSGHGRVTAVGSGFADIRPRFEYNGNVYTDSCYVSVAEQTSKITNIQMNPQSPTSLAVGDKVSISIMQCTPTE